MTNWIKKLFQNQAIRYIFFGGCTTLVNLVSYAAFRHFLGIDITVANFLSISLSILFAYVVNKLFVFESQDQGNTGASGGSRTIHRHAVKYHVYRDFRRGDPLLCIRCTGYDR